MQKIASIYAGLLTMLLATITTIASAQADIDVNIKKGGDESNWIANPIVWIVAGAIFILLLVALLRKK